MKSSSLSLATLLTLCIAASFAAGNVLAVDSIWIGSTGNWATLANWQGGQVPDSTKDAYINNGGIAQVGSFSGTPTARSLTLGSNAGQSGTVQVSASKTLTVLQTAFVGLNGTGTVEISDGGDVISDQVLLGGYPGSSGTVTVTGVGSTLTANTSLYIGSNGNGVLTIESGAHVLSDVAELGSTGTAIVTGAGSLWETSDLYAAGGSSLTVSDGAKIRSSYAVSDHQTIIDPQATFNIGAGGVPGDFEASYLYLHGTLNFNHTGVVSEGTYIYGAGAIVNSGPGTTRLSGAPAFAGTFTSSRGVLLLADHTLSYNAAQYNAAIDGTIRFDGSTVNMTGANAIRSTGGAVEYIGATINGGLLRGNLPGAGTHTIVSAANNTRLNDVTIQNSVDLIQNGATNFANVSNGGRLTSNAFLFYDGGTNTTSGNIIVNNSLNTQDFNNYGQITINSGGSLIHSLGNLASGGGSRITVNSGGNILLLGGSQLDLNGALLINNGGINGTVNVNYGSLAKGTGMYGVVNVNTGGTYSPGNSPGISTVASLSFDNTLVTSGAPTLAIELGGTSAGTHYDQLHVAGNLSLGGALAVSLINGFTPVAGQAFDILDWGSLSGTFATLQLPTLSGSLVWNTTQLYTAGILSVGLPGDYNANGMVDAADYVVWRKTYGTQAGFDLWRSHFGQMAGNGSGASANAAVPEPSALMLFALVVPFFSLRLHRLDSVHATSAARFGVCQPAP